MDITVQEPAPTVPPFDPTARDRIEQVTVALLDLCGALEVRIKQVEMRQMELEDALSALGMVQVPRG